MLLQTELGNPAWLGLQTLSKTLRNRPVHWAALRGQGLQCSLVKAQIALSLLYCRHLMSQFLYRGHLSAKRRHLARKLQSWRTTRHYMSWWD